MRVQSFTCMHVCVYKYVCICVCNLIMYLGELELLIFKDGGKSWSDIQNTICSFNGGEMITKSLKSLHPENS